jgi:hypothetical protein
MAVRESWLGIRSRTPATNRYVGGQSSDFKLPACRRSASFCLFPKWLCFRKPLAGCNSGGQNGVEAGIFMAREHTCGECPSGAVFGLSIRRRVYCNMRSQVFMHGDIVEIAKAILHLLKRREERLSQF